MKPRSFTSFALALGVFAVGLSAQAEPLRLQIGPEKTILPEGLQPFMFQSQDGILLVQAQMPFPPGYVQPAKNAYPGYPGNVRSSDHGESWQRWEPSVSQGAGPIFEGNATQLRDGTILILEWIGEGPQADGHFTGKIWESHDDWRTLTGPFEARIDLPQAKGGFDDGGKPYGGVDFHRTLLEMPDGDLLATAYCWFKGDDTPSAYMPSMLKFRSVLLRSTDRGRTWTLLSTIAVDPAVGEEGYNEPVLLRLTQVTQGPTTSYVTVREVQPGRLLLVYDKHWWGHPDRGIATKFIEVGRQEGGR